MPIEFRCTQCNKLLRTGDDTAGKQAKCPECGAVMTIPMPDLGAAAPSQPMGSFEAAQSPFAAPSSPMPQDSENPYQSPMGAGLEQQFVPSGQIRPTRVDFFEVFNRTWTVFVDRWLWVLGAALIVFFVGFGLSFLVGFVLAAVGLAAQNQAAFMTFRVIGQIIGNVIQLWLNIGMTIFLLGVVRGEEPKLGLLFAGGRYLLSIILCSVLMALIILGPATLVAGVCYAAGLSPLTILVCFLVLFLVPGIIPFAWMFLQAQPLIVDRNMGVIEALTVSRQVMAGNKLTVFLILLVATFVGILFSIVTCFFGFPIVFFLYMPVLYIVIYFGVTGQPTLADHYMMPPEEPGNSPFEQPAPGTSPGDSPFSS